MYNNVAVNRHLYIALIFSLVSALLPLQAEDTMLDGLRCGQIVTLTATPDAGYRFVSWSDGVTDNPRRAEVSQAIELEAWFELQCEAQYNIPVLFLYGHLYMINLTEWQQAGFSPAEQDVRWYRIVGDIDDPTHEGDDVEVARGFYMSRDGMANGVYYVQYALPNTTGADCTNVLRSQSFRISATGIGEDEGSMLRVIPTLVKGGQAVEVQGLPSTEACTLSVYDPTGRLLRTLSTEGSEHALLPTDHTPGCYLIRVHTRNIDRTLIYIVH